MLAETFRPLRPLPDRQLPPPSDSIGDPSELCWLALDRLVIDERYQRAMARRGRVNVMRILERFDWRKFTPVIVTPVGDGKFAIIDGQHRATAALMHPLVSDVPCMVIHVTPEFAAECFAAINGQVTAITPGQIFHARVASREPFALELQRVLDAAGVTILKYKLPGQPYRVGETFAIGTLEKSLRAYGSETLITALQSVTQSGSGNAGCLTAPLIRALCDLLNDVGKWRDAGSRLLDAMDQIDLNEFLSEASLEAKRTRQATGKVIKERLAAHLVAAMAPSMKAIAK